MDQTHATTPDPAGPWSRLPEAPRPEDWITEHHVNPVPGSISERSSLTDHPVGDSLGDGDGDGDGD
jgi:hypothetical protein